MMPQTAKIIGLTGILLLRNSLVFRHAWVQLDFFPAHMALNIDGSKYRKELLKFSPKKFIYNLKEENFD